MMDNIKYFKCLYDIMNNIAILGLFLFFNLVIVSAELGYDNPTLPRLEAPATTTSTTFINNTNSSIYWGNYLHSDYNMPTIKSFGYNQTTPAIDYANSNFVPYTGATSNVDLGIKNITAGTFIGNKSNLNFNSTHTLIVEQTGQKNNVFVVNTRDGSVGINNAPSNGYSLYIGGLPTQSGSIQSFHLGISDSSFLSTDFISSTTGTLSSVGFGLVSRYQATNGWNDAGYQKQLTGLNLLATSSGFFQTLTGTTSYVGGAFSASQINIVGSTYSGDVKAVSGIFNEPSIMSSGTVNKLAGAFGGDTLIASDKKLFFEGSATHSYSSSDLSLTIGDTYINYLSGTQGKLQFYVDGGQEMYLQNSTQNGTENIGMWVKGNISANGYIERTEVRTDEDVLEKWKLGTELLTNGTSDDTKFPNGICYQTDDLTKPIYENKVRQIDSWIEISVIPNEAKVTSTVYDNSNNIYLEYLSIRTKEYLRVYNNSLDLKYVYGLKNITENKINSYEQKIECGNYLSGEMGDVRQTFALLNRNINLYNNLTDFDTAIGAENIYTNTPKDKKTSAEDKAEKEAIKLLAKTGIREDGKLKKNILPSIAIVNESEITKSNINYSYDLIGLSDKSYQWLLETMNEVDELKAFKECVKSAKKFEDISIC